MKKELRAEAVRLRMKENLSYSEIRKRLNVSKSTLSYWLNELPLSQERILELRRQGWAKGEASREKFRATMRAKKEKHAADVYAKYRRKFERVSDESLFTSGLMLYAAEGGKKKESTIVLANTDPRIIKFFLWWMERFLDIFASKMRVQLHLYENMDIEAEKKFWQTTLGLHKSQFYKVSIRKLQKGSFTYSESFRHGTCSLYAFGVEKRTELMMAMQAFFDTHIKNKNGIIR
jgi:transposase-like protein